MKAGAAAIAVVLLLACSDATGPRNPQGSVSMPASVSVTGATVVLTQRSAPVWIEFENSAAASATVGFGVCAFAVEGYTRESRSGTPTWVQVLPLLGGCGPDILYSFDIAANGTATYTDLGSIDGDLIERAPWLKIVYRRNGEPSTRSIPVTWGVEID
jgi:hypothetical protein